MQTRPSDLMPARTAARLVNRSLSSVRAWVRSGQLVGYRSDPERSNSALCVSKQEVLDFAEGLGLELHVSEPVPPVALVRGLEAPRPSRLAVANESGLSENPGVVVLRRVTAPEAETKATSAPALSAVPEPLETEEFCGTRVRALFTEYRADEEMSGVAFRLVISTRPQSDAGDTSGLLVVERDGSRVCFQRIATRDELRSMSRISESPGDGLFRADEAVLCFSNSLSLDMTKQRLRGQLTQLARSFELSDHGRRVRTAELVAV